jgi:ATP-binding cassette, subfamily C (CFTR/MRP), member 1
MTHILFACVLTAKMGMDARSTLNALIYNKSLRLSSRARQTTSTGQAVTLMSADSQRLPDAAMTMHSIWTAPLFIAVVIYFLIDLVGVAALAGIAFLCVTIPLQGFISFKQMGIQREQMRRTDARIKLVNEILQGMKIVKYYAWEVPFEERYKRIHDNLHITQDTRIHISTAGSLQEPKGEKANTFALI